MSILQTKGLTKVYGAGENQVHALDGVDISIEKGEFIAIVGTSGSGKSTLLHMLGGLDRPTAGKVFVDGKDIFSLKDEALTILEEEKSVLCSKASILFRFLMYTKTLFCRFSLMVVRLMKYTLTKS